MDGVVLPGSASRDEALDELREGLDPQSGGEVVVEGRHRAAVQRAVVGEVGVGGDRPAARDLEVGPACSAGVERGGEAPWGAGRRVSFADVGEAHRPEVYVSRRGGPGPPGASRVRRRGAYSTALPSLLITYHLPPRPWPLVCPATVSPAK